MNEFRLDSWFHGQENVLFVCAKDMSLDPSTQLQVSVTPAPGHLVSHNPYTHVHLASHRHRRIMNSKSLKLKNQFFPSNTSQSCIGCNRPKLNDVNQSCTENFKTMSKTFSLIHKLYHVSVSVKES